MELKNKSLEEKVEALKTYLNNENSDNMIIALNIFNLLKSGNNWSNSFFEHEDIIFNNTDIEGFEVKKYINMSLYEMDKVKDDICSGCDIRPVIIDSNVEGIIIVINSECNKEIRYPYH